MRVAACARTHHPIQESSKDLDTFRLTLATEATEHMRFREAIEDKLGSCITPATTTTAAAAIVSC